MSAHHNAGSLEETIAALRAELATLREYGAEACARAAENVLARIEIAFQNQSNEVLSVEEAARRTGLSRDTIERAIRKNRLPNAGRRGKPKVRAGDLAVFPRRIVAQEEDTTYDVGADVRTSWSGEEEDNDGLSPFAPRPVAPHAKWYVDAFPRTPGASRPAV